MPRITEAERRKHRIFVALGELASEMNYIAEAAIVEGPNDAKTLKLLGYKKPILLCSKRPYIELVELIAREHSNVVILTDFDEQGIVIHKRLSKLFEEWGVKVDRFYRKRFRTLLKGARISTIEGIYSIKFDF